MAGGAASKLRRKCVWEVDDPDFQSPNNTKKWRRDDLRLGQHFGVVSNNDMVNIRKGFVSWNTAENTSWASVFLGWATVGNSNAKEDSD